MDKLNKAIKNRRSLSQRLRHSVEKLLPTVKTREHLLDLIGVAEKLSAAATASATVLWAAARPAGRLTRW